VRNIAQAKLFHNAGAVSLHRFDAQHQLIRDFPVRAPLSYQRQVAAKTSTPIQLAASNSQKKGLTRMDVPPVWNVTWHGSHSAWQPGDRARPGQ